MIYLWTGFIAAVLVLVALDLFVFHRKDEVMSIRSALKWSVFWIALALSFNVAVYFMYESHWLGLGTRPTTHHREGLDGFAAASLFLTGYIVEQSLSVDNLFVISVIFGYFAIPPKYQHRVLFWGIVGVLIMRGAMIGVGTALIQKFDWVLYVFGILLIYGAYKMLGGDAEADPKNNVFLRIARRLYPITHEFHGHRFAVHESELRETELVEEPADESNGTAVNAPAVTTPDATTPDATVTADPAPGQTAAAAPDAVARRDAPPTDEPETSLGRSALPVSPRVHRPDRKSRRWVLTPLALALVVIETTDLIFAIDSIPAIFGITDDTFLVFTSNVFAVLGLRSLYFALAGVLAKFKYLQVSLAAVLALVGVKMLANHWLHGIKGINFIMLGVVALFLTLGVVASLVADRRQQQAQAAAGGAASKPDADL